MLFYDDDDHHHHFFAAAPPLPPPPRRPPVRRHCVVPFSRASSVTNVAVVPRSHMDLNSDTSSDEEDGVAVVHAAVSLSTTKQPSANRKRAVSRPNAERWRRRSCRPQRSSETYEAEPATNPRILQVAARAAREEVSVVLGSHVKVYWSGQRCWYLGLVDDTREDRNGKRMHHVSYEDGDTAWHHLPSVGWLQAKSMDEEATLVLTRTKSVPTGASPSSQSLGSPGPVSVTPPPRPPQSDKLPRGWSVELRETATGRKYKAYSKPGESNTYSLKKAWQRHLEASFYSRKSIK